MASRRPIETNLNAAPQFPERVKTASLSSGLDQRVRPIGDPTLALASRRINGSGKRAIDLVLGWASLIFVLPALAPLSVAIRLAGCPAFSRQMRIGRRGKPFAMLGFSVNALRARAGFAAALADFVDTLGAVSLPALLNVVAGEMSLVGPAPVDAAGLGEYGSERRYYLVTRPGLVCPWRDAQGPRCAAACRDYVLNWRIRRDLAILHARMLGKDAR